MPKTGNFDAYWRLDRQREHFIESKEGLNFVPVFHNQYFFNEADIFGGAILEEKIKRIRKTIGDKAAYELFLKKKGRRPIYDIYAAFQPFNEALKAFYPFIKKLKSQVKKGDAILNLWDRTGWTASLLAGLFPEQHILTTWEGNKDVLGYKGFNFWFGNHKNISVLFCDLNMPLPLENDSIAFSVGLDAFHNFNQGLLIKELTRVVRNDGAIIFPHVHLTNAEPVPYFDRGCKQIHGMDYDKAFQNLAKKSTWRGYVFSEPAMFAYNDIAVSASIPLVSTPNTEDYNALIALLPKSWDGQTLAAFSMRDLPNIESANIIVNALLKIDLNQQKVTIEDDWMEGRVKYLLERHPIYVQRIQKANGWELSELAVKILFLAQKGYAVKEIAQQIGATLEDLLKELEILENIGLLQVLPVANSSIRLQQYLISQKYVVPKSQQNLQALWKSAVTLFSENIALVSLEDESEFSYEDCDEIVESIAIRLQNEGIKKGDTVIICSKNHTEAILVFWACMQIGAIVIPIAAHLGIERITYIEELINAKLTFVSESVYEKKRTAFQQSKVVVFDQEEALNCLYFADWLEMEEEEELVEVTVNHQDIGAILFTSGSTGEPKGVQLSHGNLYRSGALITETFHWEEEDRFFVLGGLEAMSGLRNSSIAALHVGAGVVVPSEEVVENVFGIGEAIEESQATILGSNPALLRQFVKYKTRIGNQLDSLKTVICTGSNLHIQLRFDFKTAYNLPILNYYGLTETTGICSSQTLADVAQTANSIGKPIDCIAQIVDELGNVVPLGEEGELRIFSENIMQGYFQKNSLTQKVIKDGWFYTGDLAKYTQEGALQLLGRKRNIIKTSTTEVIYLKEVEQFIRKVEEVEDVAIALYHEEDTEKMVAFIVPIDQELSNSTFKQKIRQYLITSLGERSVPNQIRLKKSLPYADNGKLLMQKLINEL